MFFRTETFSDAYTWARTVVPYKYRNKWMVFSIVLCGVAMDNFSSISAVVTLDSVQSHFNTSYAVASWVVSGYALTLGSFIILFGKLADILGPHNVFCFGINLVWICALICAAVDNSVIVVIIFRTFQGIGGAALVPSAFALAGNYFYTNPKELQIALLLVFIALTATLASGSIIGGAFAATSIGYQGLFYFTFAAGFLLGMMALFLVLPVPLTEESKKVKIKNIDFVGLFFFVVGSLLVILGLTEGGDDWKSPKAYVPLPIGFCMIVISILWELVYINNYKKHYHEVTKDIASPALSIGDEKEIETITVKEDWRVKMDLMFPKDALLIHDYILFAVGATLYYLSFAFVMSLSVEYHIYVSLDTPVIAACKILPYVVGLVLSGVLINEKEMNAIGPKLMLTLSSAAAVGGYVIMTRETYDITNGFWKFGLPGLFIYGTGNTVFFKYYFVKVFPIIPVHLQGTATGIYQAFSQIAFSVGNALLTSVVGKIYVANTPELQHQISQRFVTARYIGFGVNGILFIVTLFMGWDKKTEPEAALEESEDTVNSVKEAAV